jgi:hypothetical protein
MKLLVSGLTTAILSPVILVAVLVPLTYAQQEMIAKPPLTIEQIVQNLQQRNEERTVALRHFEGLRVYRLQYRGFPGDRFAEMIVKVDYQAPATKQFAVISQSGSSPLIDRVFKKLLESEQEALSLENQQRVALNTDNYAFSLIRLEEGAEGARYVISVIPKSKNKFLYRGIVWIDAKDFAVVRIEAEPAKNPSFWTKRSVIRQPYTRVNDFWLPAQNRTTTEVRLGGLASLSIDYMDYKITEADPLPVLVSLFK